MATIGGITLGVWKGQIVPAIPAATLFDQGGVDGYGVAFGGMKAPPQTITTITRVGTNASDYNAAFNSYRALSRSAVYVVDQMGAQWLNVIVMGVSVTPSQDPLGWIATANWTLLIQSTLP